MSYKNLTISFATHGHDGFGSQYLRKIAGWAFCWHSERRRYRYIHTPFIKLDHLSNEEVSVMNDFVGIPDTRKGRKIHVRKPFLPQVHLNANSFFDSSFLQTVKNCYFSTPKPKTENEIVIHIRRNDLHLRRKRKRDVHGTAHKRMCSNEYYSKAIPLIMKDNSNDKIVIISDAVRDELSPIFDKWSYSMISSVKVEARSDIRKSFHSMVMAKKLFLARSCFSYIAGLLNESEVYFQDGFCNRQTKVPLNHWKNWNEYVN